MSYLVLIFGALAAAGLALLVVVFVLVRSRSKPPLTDDDFGTPAREEPLAREEPPAREVPAPPRLVEPAPAPPRLVEPEPERAPPPVVEVSRAAMDAPVETPEVAPRPRYTSAPTMIPDEWEPAAPPEPVAVIEPPPVTVSPAPAIEPEPPAPAAPVEAPAGPAFEQIEKLRIPDVGLILRVSAITLGGEPLLAFVTDGFAARGREELALYVRREAFGEADVVRSLKRFAALALVVLERVEPVKPGEILKINGEIAGVPLGGYLVVEPNEPEAVPLGAHFVLLGLQRRQLTMEPAALRASAAGGAPHLTSLERTEA